MWLVKMRFEQIYVKNMLSLRNYPNGQTQNKLEYRKYWCTPSIVSRHTRCETLSRIQVN